MKFPNIANNFYFEYFCLSYRPSIFPDIWKSANVQMNPKDGRKNLSANYCPHLIGIWHIEMRKKCINQQTTLEQNRVIHDHQYPPIWPVRADISKAVDRVLHDALQHYGICPDLCLWIGNYLRRRSTQALTQSITLLTSNHITVNSS